MDSPEPVNLRVWKKDGSLMNLQNCISLRYNFYEGTRQIKLLNSNQIRTIRDVCIFSINDCEVFL